ncbi:hypothetical protein M404DRAFT_299268 [Pisolithus tinctorius Marx 270]|uniref:Uncharacterized protein n=1 Tax=Pisolithus tinctorius Marx 270 TaxID=870435 RepID=A0A0C3NJ06_PISTI|nr:hypothetical protein M404DRAFT_299268 [Pisolithus tinctorius Marx 270]
MWWHRYGRTSPTDMARKRRQYYDMSLPRGNVRLIPPPPQPLRDVCLFTGVAPSHWTHPIRSLNCLALRLSVIFCGAQCQRTARGSFLGESSWIRFCN